MQEWCGHSYMEVLDHTSTFTASLNSYFEGESYDNQELKPALLEDDVWTMIRIRNKLPQGTIKMYPSLAYTLLMHKEYKSYKCEVKLTKNGNMNRYTLYYPALDRTLEINYEAEGTREIIGWEETYLDGYGNNRKKSTTTATRMKTINSRYWGKNSVADSTLRIELNL
jgi:hypothetical protein